MWLGPVPRAGGCWHVILSSGRTCGGNCAAGRMFFKTTGLWKSEPQKIRDFTCFAHILLGVWSPLALGFSTSLRWSNLVLHRTEGVNQTATRSLNQQFQHHPQMIHFELVQKIHYSHSYAMYNAACREGGAYANGSYAVHLLQVTFGRNRVWPLLYIAGPKDAKSLQKLRQWHQSSWHMCVKW